jgi:hypothetical protein
MRIDSTGNVGIGTNSPTAKLSVSGNISTAEKTNAYIGVDIATSAGNGGDLTLKAGNGSGAGNTSGVLYLAYGRGASTASNGYMAFGRAAATNTAGLDSNGEFMRIDSAGNVGIGTSSADGYASRFLQLYGATDSSIRLTNSTTGTTKNDGSDIQVAGLDLQIINRESAAIRFYTGIAEQAAIDASGNFLVGVSSVSAAGGVSFRADGISRNVVWNRSSTSSTSYPLEFQNGGVVVGSVSYNNTSTSYNTTSDYRLKENIRPIDRALEKVIALRPVAYTWKGNGSDGEGFIAHELQEVCPQAVTGTKDEQDETGNPRYQAIDQSKLVSLLTAAIQELKAELDALKAHIKGD